MPLQQVRAYDESANLPALTFSDRPFSPVDALTPDSGYSNYTDNRSLTPHTPSTHLTTPSSIMSRKPTPPSPEMQLPWDNPFPVFATSRSPEKTKQPVNNAENENKAQATNFMRPTLSPSAQVLNRMDKIAAGPFGGSLKQLQLKASEGQSVASPIPAHNSKGRERFARPSTPQSQRLEPSNPYDPSGLAQHQPMKDEQQSMQALPAESVDEVFEQLQNETEPPTILTTASRSQTFPEVTKQRQPGPTPILRSQDPAVQMTLDQSLTSAGLGRPQHIPNDPSESRSPNPLFGSARPRSKSFNNPKDRRRLDKSPVPLVPGMLRKDFDKPLKINGSHSTSGSSSSLYSMASNARSQASSNTSWGGGDDHTAVGRSKSDASSLISSRRNRSNTNQSIASSKSSEPSLYETERFQPSFSRDELPESPVDPAIQFGIGGRQRSGTPSRRPSEPISRSSPPRDRTESRSRSREADVSLPPRTPATRGPCHACQQQIMVGEKSVKDSTGRLSGRYHKACFVCKTCSAPFLTGEFYVHDNSPFCARHWHEHNGSLCHGCDNGIEGQYLETDRKEKYHTTCFRCATCRSKLDEEYFEFDGKPYCERHSWAFGPRNHGNLEIPGGSLGAGRRYGRSPEKRRTRLMMMMI